MAAIDRFKNASEHMYSAPYTHAEAVTPSDTVDLNVVSRALYVGVGGHITAVMYPDGEVVLYKSVPNGTTLRIRCTRVNSTATAATDIVALS